MHLNYKNIYIINGEKRTDTDLSKEKKAELSLKLESQAMQALGFYPIQPSNPLSFPTKKNP